MPREHSKDLEEERKAKTAYDLMRIRLERLQRNVEKPAPIPKLREPPKPRAPPEFVRNVVGSSAAAGSAEFHIFRNNRRRELARLEYIEKTATEKELDEEYEERNRLKREAEEAATAKRRLKRQRRKEHKKRNAKKPKKKGDEEDSDEDDEDTEGEDAANKSEHSGDEEPVGVTHKHPKPPTESVLH